MLPVRQWAAICLVFVFGLAIPPAVEAEEEAWLALSDGGIVLFRHALAPGTGDPRNFRIGDCETQRNLDAAGRDDARKIGNTFRDRGIRVDQVLTSEWCRCWETAELAFPGQWTREPAFNSFFQNRSAGPAQTAAARTILEQWQGPGALVVITHQVNITALTDIFPASGEGIVLRSGPDGLVLAGRLPVSAFR
ncbi:histidine phosphatase family protein [Roseibium aquae]|nr:histidine phosphatase family protein [Roseibium aquae]